jgi:hypothetical protein
VIRKGGNVVYAKFLRIEQDRTAREVCDAARIPRLRFVYIERNSLVPNDTELKRLANVLKYDGDPRDLLRHVSASPLGDGAEARSSEREHKQS